MTLAQRRRPQPSARYGSVTFAETLAAREAALGLTAAPVVQDVAQASNASDDTVAGSSAAEPGDARPLPGDVSVDAQGVRRDMWGNVLVSGDEQGPHTIRSLWDGRVIRVCGEYRTGRHNSWWCFDEDSMRPVCQKCWPMAQGRR